MSNVTIPPSPNVKEIDKAIRKAMTTSGRRIVRNINKELKKRNWKPENMPKWYRARFINEGGDLSLLLELKKGSPFPFVDKGTEGPYTITAKFAPMLKFKVKPSFSGDTGWRSTFKVEHPGIDAQNISEPIILEEAIKLGKFIDKQLDKLEF